VATELIPFGSSALATLPLGGISEASSGGTSATASGVTITATTSVIAGAASGIVTFAASSGGAVRSFGDKLRTAGQYATAELKMIANRYYQLSGDLQV
jgi:hypothetical protein